LKPQPKAVNDTDWKEHCTRQQKAPKALTETSEDVREPCDEARDTYDYGERHLFLLT